MLKTWYVYKTRKLSTSLSAIEDARTGHISQRASGNYSIIDKNIPDSQEKTNTGYSSSESERLIKEIGMLINTLKILKYTSHYVTYERPKS